MNSEEAGKNYLEHYGVKGMRWGVRRTRAQLARASQKRKEANDPNTPEGAARAARASAKENRRVISDGDLDAFVQRLEKEKKLKNLVEEDLTPGEKAVKAVASNAGKKAGTVLLTGIAVTVGRKAVVAALGSGAAGDIKVKK